MVDLTRLLGEASPHILKVLLDIVMDADNHLLEFRGGKSPGWRIVWLFFFGNGLLFLDVDGAGMGQSFHPGCAASRAGDLLFPGLFLVILKTGKPAFELMLFRTEQVVNDHKIFPNV